jgi:hypothetical protein
VGIPNVRISTEEVLVRSTYEHVVDPIAIRVAGRGDSMSKVAHRSRRARIEGMEQYLPRRPWRHRTKEDRNEYRALSD